MKLNFKKLKVEVSIDNFVEQDLSAQVGNFLFSEATTVPMSDLARKIYHSKGEMEMTKKEYTEMMRVLSAASLKYLVKTAIEDQAREMNVEQFKEEE